MKKILFIISLSFMAPFLGAQNLSLSTNLADIAAGGTMNLEAAYGFARHWSVNAGVKYNPFSFGKGQEIMQMKQRSLSAGARWWPWHIFSGWWTGARLQYQEFSEAGLGGPGSTEGDRFGGGISAGYSRMIGRHLNLDFGLGLWTGYSIYSIFECHSCGRRIESGSKAFLLPNEVLIGINYIF